jgi:uncharacterized membrane protein YedE/YeeE
MGTAAVLLMAFHGRIAGVTGILAGLLPPAAKDQGWRLAFLMGMAVAPAVYHLALPGVPLAFESGATPAVLVIGGFLVGIGVTFSSGCTSGHGVCGLARFSTRSLAAVGTFMASTAVTVFVTRHVLGG